jgi:hypothetical protein
MPTTRELALELLEQWRADGSWVFAVVRFSGGDEHQFWARVRTASTHEIWLAGESAMVSLRLESNGCQYLDLSTNPPEFDNHLKDFARCLTIRCGEFSAVLGVLKPDANPDANKE